MYMLCGLKLQDGEREEGNTTEGNNREEGLRDSIR